MKNNYNRPSFLPKWKQKILRHIAIINLFSKYSCSQAGFQEQSSNKTQQNPQNQNWDVRLFYNPTHKKNSNHDSAWVMFYFEILHLDATDYHRKHRKVFTFSFLDDVQREVVRWVLYAELVEKFCDYRLSVVLTSHSDLGNRTVPRRKYRCLKA